MFAPGSKALALTHLNVYDSLNTDLATLLVSHAPVLTDLGVFSLMGLGEECGDLVWGVERLCVQ